MHCAHSVVSVAIVLLIAAKGNGKNGFICRIRIKSLDTALRLARYFGTTPQFWMNLQNNFELRLAEDQTGQRIRDEITTIGAVQR